MNTVIVFGVMALLGIPFLLYGIYFFCVGLMGLRRHNKFDPVEKKHRFAAVIAARNEGAVIGNLIDTLKAQHYPKELLDIYVIPNNCTDDTKEQALAHGAKTFTCTKEVRSKGAALEQFFDAILKSDEDYDAFCVFDADNLVDPNFFDRMNNAYAAGATVAQGYRESKNPKDSWISGSQTVFYMIVNRFLNLPRQALGLSAVLNGTGFMVSRKALEEGGWHTHTLTEDIEYTVQRVIQGHKVTWVPEAVTYDEHPLTFDTSWKQRKRWSTGVLQCCSRYTKDLWRTYRTTKDAAALDMILYVAAPALQIMSIIYILFSTLITTILFNGFDISALVSAFAGSSIFLVIGVCAISTYFIVRLEKHLGKDIKGATFLSFWWYLGSWMFINFDCIIRPLTSWEPIAHTQSVSMAQLAVRN